MSRQSVRPDQAKGHCMPSHDANHCRRVHALRTHVRSGVRIHCWMGILGIGIFLGGCGAFEFSALIDSNELDPAPNIVVDSDIKTAESAQGRAIEPIGSAGRASVNKKGSLLFYPHVEVKWNADGTLRQDTFLQLSNDFADDVQVQLYLVNGDAPTDAVYTGNPPVLVERKHSGWNKIDVQIPLTGDEPTYWSAITGNPKGVSSFSILDPGVPVGRPDPDPDNIGGRVIRGFVLGWAVNAAGHEIRWNHLSGSAMVMDYRQESTWEYPAWAFASHALQHGVEPESCKTHNLDTGRCVDGGVEPGEISLDGYEYDSCPERLQFQFPAVGGNYLAGPEPDRMVIVDASLTLAVLGVDLRQDTSGPITTKAKFDIWNENEIRFSGTERCITCWDLTPLGQYTRQGIANHFFATNLQTRVGRARVDGVASTVCAGGRGQNLDTPILGVMQKIVRFPRMDEEMETASVLPKIEKSGLILGGQGEEVARILYDIVAPPEEARGSDGE